MERGINIKPLYELNVKEFKEKYESGELSMLEYLKDYITDDLNQLYLDVLQYNEIFCNGWTLNDLFKMGKKDSYWTDRANVFIKKYDVKPEDYDNYTKFFDQYTELRDDLLDKLGLYEYLDVDSKDLAEFGYICGDQLVALKELENDKSYTVARTISFGNCVELHYCDGKATIEYGYKISHDYWESIVEEIDWFSPDMNENKMMDKLFEIYDEYFRGKKEKEIDNMLDINAVKEHIQYLKNDHKDREFYVALLLYDILDLKVKDITEEKINKVYEIERDYDSIYNEDLRDRIRDDIEVEEEQEQEEEIEK